MKKSRSLREATYQPQTHKNFRGALEGFFSIECPQIGGVKTRAVLVDHIIEMVSQYYPATTHMKPGQVRWVTIHKDELPSYGKSIRECKLVTVTLDLIKETDARDRVNGMKGREIKKNTLARLCQQTFAQGGCITSAELAIIMKIDATEVGRLLIEWEEENNELLPRRGTIHDMGPTLTHKRVIIHKLFIEGKRVTDVCRETNHSPEAIQRYISTFKQVLLCKKRGMTTREIAFSINHTMRLVREYEDILEVYSERSSAVANMMNEEFEINLYEEACPAN